MDTFVVEVGITVTVKEGVHIEFSNEGRILVNGNMHFLGSPEKLITVNFREKRKDYEGTDFLIQLKNYGNIVRNTIFTNGGLKYYNPENGLVKKNATTNIIENCEFHYSRFCVDSKTNLKIFNCLFDTCMHGINVEGSATVENSKFENCGSAIHVFGSENDDYVTISKCEFRDTIRGIFLYYIYPINVTDNIFSTTQSGAISIAHMHMPQCSPNCTDSHISRNIFRCNSGFELNHKDRIIGFIEIYIHEHHGGKLIMNENFFQNNVGFLSIDLNDGIFTNNVFIQNTMYLHREEEKYMTFFDFGVLGSLDFSNNHFEQNQIFSQYEGQNNYVEKYEKLQKYLMNLRIVDNGKYNSYKKRRRTIVFQNNNFGEMSFADGDIRMECDDHKMTLNANCGVSKYDFRENFWGESSKPTNRMKIISKNFPTDISIEPSLENVKEMYNFDNKIEECMAVDKCHNVTCENHGSCVYDRCFCTSGYVNADWDGEGEYLKRCVEEKEKEIIDDHPIPYRKKNSDDDEKESDENSITSFDRMRMDWKWMSLFLIFVLICAICMCFLFCFGVRFLRRKELMINETDLEDLEVFTEMFNEELEHIEQEVGDDVYDDQFDEDNIEEVL